MANHQKKVYVCRVSQDHLFALFLAEKTGVSFRLNLGHKAIALVVETVPRA